MDFDMVDFDDDDKNDVDKNSFEKFVASKENDGYRDGLSAGTLSAFTEEFQAGFCSTVPIFVKLFQLHKILSRSSGYYKLDATPQKFDEMIPALIKATETVTQSISSTFLKSPTTNISLISQMSTSNTDVASMLSCQKLHEGCDLQTSTLHWVSLQKDLKSIHAFFENLKPSSYLESAEFSEMFNLLKALICL